MTAESAVAETPRIISPPRRMTVANIVRGPVQKPLRILIYGVDGIGKTTFAYNAPGSVFIGVEDGTAKLDAPRYPQPKTWREVLEAVDDLAVAEHDFKTVALDTLDWIEPLVWSHIVGTGKRTKAGKLIESIGDLDYGKGYEAAVDEWRVLCSKLERLRDTRGMMSVLVAHSEIKNFKNPEGEDFERYQLKLHKSAAALLREWADIVLFATHETYTSKKSGQAKAKGISTGARVIYTERRAAWDAKNRHNLPEMLPLDWQEFEAALALGQSATPETLRARIRALLSEMDDAALSTRVNTAVERVGDNTAELARIANKLTAEMAMKERQQEATT